MGELIDRDAEHLRLLTLSYYILAGITGFFALMPAAFFLIFGSLISSGAFPPTPQSSQADTRVLGTMMLSAGAAAFVAGSAGAVAAFLTGRNIRDHRRRTFCIVVAAISCLYIPWGTMIGVFTIVVLNRPTVKALFGDLPPN
jgi:hypothetical protein